MNIEFALWLTTIREQYKLQLFLMIPMMMMKILEEAMRSAGDEALVPDFEVKVPSCIWLNCVKISILLYTMQLVLAFYKLIFCILWYIGMCIYVHLL